LGHGVDLNFASLQFQMFDITQDENGNVEGNCSETWVEQ